MALIELKGIQKSYPDGSGRSNTILRDVSFSVEKGESVAVTGPSGSGKTTLLRMLGTLLEPDEGTYLLDGENPFANPYEVRNRKIGFVFQDHRLLPQYTVLQNVLLPCLAISSSASQDQIAYARSLMSRTGIEALEAQYPSTLSGGEAGRVALCRALVMQPLLVLADEPTGQLDSDNAGAILSLLTELVKERSTTLIMVTHSEQTAAAAARRLCIENRTVIDK
ncbi:MAG: ABC transporter ATP-binding protein [Bacteroidales bacterium]|nr:ABC transporter ATP-binding protein [Bacteroidales bacterium]